MISFLGKAGGSGATGSHVLYGDSEELNKVVVLTLARSIQLNGLEPQGEREEKSFAQKLTQ